MPHLGELELVPTGSVLPTQTLEISPNSGDTISAFNGKRNFLYIVDMTGDYAALTFQLPSDSNSYDNQIGNFLFRHAVANLQFTGPTTIRAPNSASANGWIVIRRVKAGEWTKPSET